MTQTRNLNRPLAAFGLHLTLDGYGAPRHCLADLDLVYQFLEEAPDRIHMTKIMPPYVFKYHGKVAEDWGVSGFVLIAESHISVHTFPERNYLSLDIFSCKAFDTRLAAAFAKETFGLDHYEINILDRGLEFPRAIQPVADYLLREREGMEANQGKGGPDIDT